MEGEYVPTPVADIEPAMFAEPCCSACGIRKRTVRSNHLETCPESPSGETPEWEMIQ